MLEEENFEVIREPSMERLDDEEFLKTMDLIIPMWTQGQLDDRYCFHLSDAVISGVGLAGCHGGMCDSFRWNIEYQFMTGSQWVSHPGTHWYHHISDLSPENLEYVKKFYPSPDGAFYSDYRVNFKHGCASPIVEGLEDFDVTTEQYYLHLDPCVNVLATTQVRTRRTGKSPCLSHTPRCGVMAAYSTRPWGTMTISSTSHRLLKWFAGVSSGLPKSKFVIQAVWRTHTANGSGRN